MNRTEAVYSEALKEDLAYINCMISVAFELLMLFNQGKSMKKILAKNLETLIEFNQHFV
jgi:hypothetical protein